MLRSFYITYFFRVFSGRGKSVRPGKSMRACIFKLDRIGDFVLATGVIRYIVREYGSDQCLLIVSPVVKKLARAEFPETPVISIPWFGGRMFFTAFRIWRHVRPILAAYDFQHLICLRHQPDLHRDIILSWIQAKRSFGTSEALGPAWYQNTGASAYVFTHPFDYPQDSVNGICKELEAHAQVVRRVFNRELKSTEILPKLRSIRSEPGNYLLISPFASTPIKDFSGAPLTTAILNWQQKTKQPIRLCGTVKDVSRLRECLSDFIETGITDVEILSTPSLASFATAIAEAGLILTVDTATAHIATALNKPTVVLLAGGHYGMFGPWHLSAKQQWLTCHMECFGCNFYCKYSEPYCLRKIPPDDITEALLAVWELRDEFI